MTKNSTTKKKKEKKNPLKLKKEEKVKKYRYVKESDNLRRFDYRGRRRRRKKEGQSFREMGKKTQIETEKTLFPRIGNLCNGNTENRYIWVFLPVFF